MIDRAADIEVSVALASRMQACIDKDKEHTGHVYDALAALLPTVAVQCEMTREAFLKDMGNAYDVALVQWRKKHPELVDVET